MSCGCQVSCETQSCADKPGVIRSATDLEASAYPPYSISQLFMDEKPLLHYWTGQPFYFRTEQTPFLYLVPNAIMVKTGGATYRVSTVSAAQESGSCADCTGY